MQHSVHLVHLICVGKGVIASVVMERGLPYSQGIAQSECHRMRNPVASDDLISNKVQNLYAKAKPPAHHFFSNRADPEGILSPTNPASCANASAVFA